MTQTVWGTTAAKGLAGFYRSMVQTVKNTVFLKGSPTRIVRLIEAAAALYGMKAGAGFNRGITDTSGIGSGMGGMVAFLRTLFGTAGSEAVPLRHLFIFLRLLTAAYIRDYIIGRFLKSKEELIIKSPVCREITLDSTLH
jgi:hypothetical protein